MSSDIPETVTEQDLDEIKKANSQKFLAIARSGAALDRASVIAVRLETFIDMFIPEEDRTTFEFFFEKRMQESLNDALKEIRQRELTANISSAPKNLLLPGQ